MTSKILYQRVRASQAALMSRGGKRLTGYLQPMPAQALADLLEAGYARSAVGVISAALIDASRKVTRVTKP